jgi:hypothetical protein
MIVTTQSKGGSIIGLLVGASNVRRHFRAHSSAVDLELDHLRIRCDLEASFWRDRPEISDPRLGAWLQSKCSRALRQGSAVTLRMVRRGDSYRLTLARAAPLPDSSRNPSWTV